MEALGRLPAAPIAGGLAAARKHHQSSRQVLAVAAAKKGGEGQARKKAQPRRGAHREQRKPWEAPPDDFVPPGAPLEDARHGLLHEPLPKLDSVYENGYHLVHAFVETTEETERRLKGRETGALALAGVAARVQVQKFFGMELDWDTVPTTQLERDLEALGVPAVYPLDFMNFKEGQEDLTPPHLRTDRDAVPDGEEEGAGSSAPAPGGQ